jgi:lysosomal alpha-mannosidase
VNGGWSANDEANPNYQDILNNMMIGHQFLHDEFGVTPTVGWDIDTFGHSATNTRIFSELGYDTMFFSRIDYLEKDQRNTHQSMNFLWRPDVKHFGSDDQILTSVFKDDYCFPTGFYTGENYDSDDPFISDPTLKTFNANEKMIDFINLVNDFTKIKKGKNLMIAMGCDFTYQNAK